MCRAVALFALLVACSGAGTKGDSSKVDPAIVGSWELDVPNAQGVARWMWDINGDGSYAFHAEGPGNVPSHHGVFAASNGRYTLRSTTLAWADTGTYQLARGNTLNATGKLGTAVWTRVKAAAGQPPSDSAPMPALTPNHSATELYDYLSHRKFRSTIVDPPLRITRTDAVSPDARAQSDGVIGIVRARVESSADSGAISYVVFRDSAMADDGYAIFAIADSKRFRVAPGEYVSSHAYRNPEFGEARCLSRLRLHTSTTATVTCYLLVRYPIREPVIIESEVSKTISESDSEASPAAVQRAADLLFAAIKQWAIDFPTTRAARAN
jgi:hypothetical protein